MHNVSLDKMTLLPCLRWMWTISCTIIHYNLCGRQRYNHVYIHIVRLDLYYEYRFKSEYIIFDLKSLRLSSYHSSSNVIDKRVQYEATNSLWISFRYLRNMRVLFKLRCLTFIHLKWNQCQPCTNTLLSK